MPTRSDLGFRRWAAGLLDQQLWCLGRDIARPDGNVLLGLGMCRYRAPGGEASSLYTLYTAAVESGGSLFLWGFGAMYAEPGAGGVFVRRHDFAPRLTARESAVGVFDPVALGRLTTPTAARELAAVRTLLPRLAGWFARYEHWIAETHGPAYRTAVLAVRAKPPAVPAGHMAAAWERAAKGCRRFRAEPAATVTPWGRLLHRLRPADVRPARHRPPTRVRT